MGFYFKHRLYLLLLRGAAVQKCTQAEMNEIQTRELDLVNTSVRRAVRPVQKLYYLSEHPSQSF